MKITVKGIMRVDVICTQEEWPLVREQLNAEGDYHVVRSGPLAIAPGKVDPTRYHWIVDYLVSENEMSIEDLKEG